MKKHLTVYVRRGCHLCSDMTVALRRLQDELGFTVSEIDIDRDPVLVERYGAQVPVLTGEDVELCHYFLDADRLRAWCAGSGKASGRVE
ncbi:MAG: glutaredoxin family protein [Gammaproteobacteria bacterium]